MPEGDTVHKIARRIASRVCRERLRRLRVLDREYAELAGEPVGSVVSRGKHLLVSVGERAVLHVHLGLHGRWQATREGARFRRPPGDAEVLLSAGSWTFTCYGPSTRELLDARRLAEHPILSQLGPDLLSGDPDLEEVLRRARSMGGPSLGELLLDQRVACGIGNVYKNEALFLERRSPWARPEGLGDEELLALYRRSRRIMLPNLERRRRVTTGGALRETEWVYGRDGRPCLRCGATIRFARQGELQRKTYWCPSCQGEPTGRSGS